MTELVPAHMIPRHVSLVEHIPFTLGGKIDRRAVDGPVGGRGHRPRLSPTTGSRRHRWKPLLPRSWAMCSAWSRSVLTMTSSPSVGIRCWRLRPSRGFGRGWTPRTSIVADIFATRTVSALAGLLGRREREPGRLDQVAELYLEVIHMEAARCSVGDR